MRCVIVLSGEIRDDAAARLLLSDAGLLICADGGARHLRRLQILPDLLVGDMDSLSAPDLAWLDSQNVPFRRYPTDKEETDSELALRLVLAQLPEPRGQHEIVLLAAFGSRPDHVMANQMMAAGLAQNGWRLILADGVTTMYTLAGGQTLPLVLPAKSERSLVLSIIPAAGPVSGLHCPEGLIYPLVNAALPIGSTRGISNRISHCQAEISLGQGVVLVCLTPED